LVSVGGLPPPRPPNKGKLGVYLAQPFLKVGGFCDTFFKSVLAQPFLKVVCIMDVDVSLSYRFATSNDRDVIMKGILEILFLEENKTSFFSAEKHQEQEDLISNAIDKNTIIVAEKNNEVVGFIWFNVTNKSFYGLDYGNLENHYMFISYIWIIESSRNTGIAMQLYDRVITYAKERHIKKIWLDIYMSNEKSIHFHNKLGFQPQITLYSKDI
jgi:ribosomal protein S18 acetylase RimI-like enzyme